MGSGVVDTGDSLLELSDYPLGFGVLLYCAQHSILGNFFFSGTSPKGDDGGIMPCVIGLEVRFFNLIRVCDLRLGVLPL